MSGKNAKVHLANLNNIEILLSIKINKYLAFCIFLKHHWVNRGCRQSISCVLVSKFLILIYTQHKSVLGIIILNGYFKFKLVQLDLFCSKKKLSQYYFIDQTYMWYNSLISKWKEIY